MWKVPDLKSESSDWTSLASARSPSASITDKADPGFMSNIWKSENRLNVFWIESSSMARPGIGSWPRWVPFKRETIFLLSGRFLRISKQFSQNSNIVRLKWETKRIVIFPIYPSDLSFDVSIKDSKKWFHFELTSTFGRGSIGRHLALQTRPKLLLRKTGYQGARWSRVADFQP